MSREPATLLCRLALGSALTLFSLTCRADEATPQNAVRVGKPSAGLAVVEDEGAAEEEAAAPAKTEAVDIAEAGKSGPPPKLVPIPEPKTEVITERHSNRTVRTERHVTQDAQGNYINHGSWSNWDDKGVLRGTGAYRDGMRQGKWVRWFNAGEGKLFATPFFKQFQAPFVAEATFVDDKLEGKWIILDSKGRTTSEWEFSRGQLHGLSIWYFPSGHTQREVPYQNGQIEGEVREWAFIAPAGQKAGTAQAADLVHSLVNTIVYQNGQRKAPHVEYYSPGVKKVEGFYFTARETLKTEHDFWNGVLQTAASGTEGTKQRCGLWTWYYPDGGKLLEGEFVANRPTGLHTWWYANGQKKTEGEFEGGQEVGRWCWWHTNGLKQMEGDYAAGAQTGRWTRWNELGKVIEAQDLDSIDVRGTGGEGPIAETRPIPPAPIADAEPAAPPSTMRQPVPFRVQTARPRTNSLRR